MATHDQEPSVASLGESLEDLYEHAPCGYVSTRPDGTIVRVNETLLTWLGLDRAAIVGARFQSLLTVPSKIFWETHCAPLLRMQRSLNEIALDLVCRPNRRGLPVLVNISVRLDASREPAFHRITVFDATERRRYERELLLARRRAEEVAQSRADFLSVVSHEIRAPLNNVGMVAELLGRGDLTPEQERWVAVLKSASEHVLGLVNGLLDFSRIDAGMVEVVAEPVNLGTLLRELVDEHRIRTDAAGVALRAEIDPRLPRLVLGDPQKLRQIVSNLLGNAAKFTEEGAIVLRLTVEGLDESWVTLELSVEDTGIGIAPEELTQIFDPFAQASSHIGQRFGGTGLGLAVTRKLLELLGSTIRVDSAPGSGSRFCFELRLRRADPVPRG